VIIGLIIAFVLFLLLQLLLVLSQLYPSIPKIVRMLGMPILWLSISLFYFALFESARWQATPGKMVFGLTVTTADGDRLSIMRGFGRTLSRLVAGLLTLQIGYMIAAFTQKKQGLHDLLAGTVVVVKNKN